MIKLAFIGAGNVAWHLAPALEKGGAEVKGIYSKTPKSAKKLAQRLYDVEVFPFPDFSALELDIALLSVPDDAISIMAKQVILPPGCLLVHVSGAKPLSLLEGNPQPKGVFYPLQTFNKAKKEMDFTTVPICIEGENQETLDKLADLAWTISNQVYHLSSKERLKLHVAAVISCNFANHLFTLANDFLKDTELDFSFLKPLIEETVEKALNNNPAEVQTGPAIRGDQGTLETHRKLLQPHPDIYQVYQFLTKRIEEYHGK